MDKKHTCCFTGHRRLPKDKIERIVKRLDCEVDNLISQGVTDFISGGALGFDQIAASLIIANKEIERYINLILALPCRNQDDLWNNEQKQLCRDLLAEADEIVYVSEEYSDGCMKKRNRYMIDCSDYCLCALLHTFSGTDYTVRYARQKGAKVLNVAYINLETNLTVSSYFTENIEPERIIRFLETEVRERIIPGETLIIFDEIQSCERALTSLKYFNEKTPEYHIVCAGSLLGVAINRDQYSFPVGNVDSMTLFPLDFEEFLWAVNDERLCEDIKQAFDLNEALPAALHEKALDLYRMYLIVGGMPRAVLEYVQGGSLIPVPDVQNKIINDYIADMAKYASNAESVKIRAAYNSIPVQLAKENKKFQYKLAQRGGTETIFGSAIDWLHFAGVVLKCGRIEQGFMPISVYSDLASFKLYMSDVGLLTMKSGISQQAVLSASELDNTFLGAITENYVAQVFAAKTYGLFYWTTEGKAELDFVLQKGNDIIGVEVKTGTRTKSKSLAMFVEKYKPTYSIRISSKNFGFDNNIKSVPLYAVFCI